MATYRVKPLPDGVAQRSNWQVTKNGTRKSTHTKKSAAEREARRRARVGDTIVLHGVEGRVIDRYRYSGSRDGSDDKDGSLEGWNNPFLNEDDPLY